MDDLTFMGQFARCLGTIALVAGVLIVVVATLYYLFGG